MNKQNLPKDVKERVGELLSMKPSMPILYESIDVEKAEYINQFSDGWVEVFVLFNNEDGAHYIFQKEGKEL